MARDFVSRSGGVASQRSASLVPALRKEREGRGTRLVCDASVKSRATRPGILFWNSHGRSWWKISNAGTVYNFDTIDVDGKPEVAFKCLKRLVGERGFEPPTPWSRTRFRKLLNATEFSRPQAIGVEGVAAAASLVVDLC